MTTLATSLQVNANRDWPRPGAYRGIAFDTYAALDAAHATALKCLATSTPAHYQWEKAHPTDTKTLYEGRAMHHFILEPDTFWQHYVRAGQCDGIKKSGERCEHPGKFYCGGKWYCGVHVSKNLAMPCDPIDDDLHRRLLAMHAAVWAHPTAAEMLEPQGRETELSLVWVDPGTKTLCKARLDAFRPDDMHIVDLKKCTDASEDGFARAVRVYGYAVQAAWYERAAKACLGTSATYRFTFVAVEDDSSLDDGGPHGVQTFALDDETMEVGRLAAQSALEVYAACQKADRWPGYSPRTKLVGIGKWAIEREKQLSRTV